MATINRIIVWGVKWPPSWFQVEERNDIVATYYIRDRGHVVVKVDIRAEQLGVEIPLNLEVSSECDWRIDVHTPGLAVTVSQGGRFA